MTTPLDELRDWHRRTGASHYASSASVLGVLLFVRGRMRDGDVCLLSKAHAISAYRLVFDGHLPDEPLVQGEFGSLGSALPFALGVAKMRPESTVWVVCGDGEMQEGSNLEALAAMDRLGIDNVRVVVDANGMQGMGDVPPQALPRQVGWHVTHKGSSWEAHYQNA